jgi:hypothetical protein
MLKNPDIRSPQRAVIAALLLLVLWCGWQSKLSSQGPSSNPNDPAKNNSSGNQQKQEGGWGEPIVVVTFLLFAVGAAQLGLFYRQLKLIRESLEPATAAAKAAKDTAAAALLQARAAIGADRSELIVSHISLVYFPESDRSNQNVPIPNGVIERNELRAIVHFTNSGRSRSRMTELCIEWAVVPRPANKNADPSEVPIYTNPVGANHIFAPDQTIPIKWLGGDNSIIRLLPDQRMAINSNTAWLWIYGSFVYADFMDEIYDAGFVAHWEAVAGGTIGPAPLPNPRGIVLEGPPAYIYRRNRAT